MIETLRNGVKGRQRLCDAGQEADGEKQPADKVDWERMKVQVAAAVLELLVSASLMLQPIDADALKYVGKTARLLQVTSLACEDDVPQEADSVMQR